MHTCRFASRLVLRLALLFAGGGLFSALQAQDAEALQANRPDWEELEARFSGPDGAKAYSQLSAQLDTASRRLALAQAFYYGSYFVDGANAGRDDFQALDLASLANKADAPTLLALCDSVLAIRPADLTANYYKGLGLYLVDTTDLRSVHYRDRYVLLCNTILSSGTGAACPTAMDVLSENDAMEVMRFLSIRKMVEEPLENAEEGCQRYRITASPIYRSRIIHFMVH